jgi:hypothetical protein
MLQAAVSHDKFAKERGGEVGFGLAYFERDAIQLAQERGVFQPTQQTPR